METKFNFKSQVCTSRVQSERLLALGLKPETADCHWRLQPYYNDEGFDCGLEWSCDMGTFLQDDAHELFFDYIPAWSLHRLILLCKYNDDDFGTLIPREGTYDYLIESIAYRIKEGYFNKEYLV